MIHLLLYYLAQATETASAATTATPSGLPGESSEMSDPAVQAAAETVEKVGKAIESLPIASQMSPELRSLLVISTAILITLLISQLIPRLIQFLLNRLASANVREVYDKVFSPHNRLIGWVISLMIGDIVILILRRTRWGRWTEVAFSLILTLTISWLGSRLFRQYFDVYLLDAAVRKGRKVNSELLVVGKYLANFAIAVVAITLFAETHDFNIFGLFASLGIGGLAIAFAAQKTLEQLLGGVVIYVDRPFVVDDYVGLPDGTFGRVESIGLRSTKIRTSGKGTLVIVPNSALSEATIENFTGAKKVMSIIYLKFYRIIPGEEAALIRQVILESTDDIFGIDSRNTDVTFREIEHGQRSQAQITFFILGSGEVSMELRRQLLDIANQKITRRLKEYGIAFDIDEPTIYVDSPITI